MRYSILRIILLPIVIVFASCINDDDYSNGSIISAGAKLPHFKVQLNDGRTFDSSENGDSPTVIIFFNTSCEDCRTELPEIESAYNELKNDVTFIAISREENQQSIEEYWNAEHLTLPFSAQTDRHIYTMFALSGIPRIYISDSRNIVYASFGPDDAPTAETLKQAIYSILHS